MPLIGVGTIKAGINADDYDETLSLINNELNNIKAGNFSDDKIDHAKTTYLNSLTELEDSPENIVSLYTGIEYLGSDNIDVRRKKIQEVTKDQIVAVANKIHLNMIYLLEGTDVNEEE